MPFQGGLHGACQHALDPVSSSTRMGCSSCLCSSMRVARVDVNRQPISFKLYTHVLMFLTCSSSTQSFQ
jgi:hypothetical protein